MNLPQLLQRWPRLLLLAFALTQATSSAEAATYQVGQTVTNFSFTARRAFTRPDGTLAPAGSTVQLSDFAGRVVFFEWFAVWCPFCVAAAGQVDTGIVDWYAARGGNPYGVPVIHVAVNQESASFYQSQTEGFINQHGFSPVVNDYGSTGTNRVRRLFQTSGQPVFVVINGVTNSPSHQPWQVLVNHLGYGDTDFNTELTSFRTAINAVQPPVLAPRLTAARRVGAHFEFGFQPQPGRSYRVQGSTNLTDWATLRTLAGSTNPVVFRDSNAPPARRFYRAVTP